MQTLDHQRDTKDRAARTGGKKIVVGYLNRIPASRVAQLRGIYIRDRLSRGGVTNPHP